MWECFACFSTFTRVRQSVKSHASDNLFSRDARLCQGYRRYTPPDSSFPRTRPCHFIAYGNWLAIVKQLGV
jgi:hypothetical protein